MKKPGKESDPKTGRYEPMFDSRFTLQPKSFELASLGHDSDEQFELKFVEEVLAQDPCNEDALMLLGHTYTQLGKYEKGLNIDRRLVKLRPADPMVYYNLACSHSLLRNIDAALAALDRAASLGYRDVKQMLGDPDLANVRQDSRFRRWANRIFGHSARDS